ncbi:hypothetical protein L873DRAFT_1895843 [Choiromyces venosus 120613-1]|uniref:Uncharacterized protein n=1 Tax=Choiromyces venosus 120613-1 TaxID=1336337 RepID=A0A3N4IXJ4_9PEZI|nr:hypothetical protein L873DRAFT_1895843 [Choiromyces venosus 120613-1]
MEGRVPIVPAMLEVQQPVDASRMADEPREIVHLGATGSRGGRAAKLMDWMDHALVRQVLATDLLNCGRGTTVAKWAEVADVLQRLEPQPILQSQESCCQRVKKHVEIYKKSGINEYFAQEKAAGLKRDGRRVREDSMRGLVRRQDEGEDSLEGTISGATAPPTKKPKNATMKVVEKVLEEFTAGMREDKEEMKELEAKHDQKHEDLMRGILGLTDEIREQSEQRSHDAYLD